MKIVDVRKSLETCTESGWDALDVMTDEPLDDKDIVCLKEFDGSFMYMKMLKKPFFKLEYHDYVFKGVKGDNFFRAAFHRDSREKIDEMIKSLSEKWG